MFLSFGHNSYTDKSIKASMYENTCYWFIVNVLQKDLYLNLVFGLQTKQNPELFHNPYHT